MTNARRFVAGVDGDRHVRRRRVPAAFAPAAQCPAEFSNLGSATMPFVPNGDFVTSAWFCAGVPVGGPPAGWGCRRRQPGRGGPHRQDHHVHRCSRGRVGCRIVRGSGTRHQRLRSRQDPAAGHIRLRDGGDLWRRRIRRAARRQCVGQCGVAMLELGIVDVVLRRRLHRRRQPRNSWSCTNPFPPTRSSVSANRPAPRARSPPSCRACSVKANSVLVISQDLLAKRELVAGGHRHQHPWSSGRRSGPGVSDVGRPGRFHDDPRRAVARPTVLLRRRRGRRQRGRRAIQHLQRLRHRGGRQRRVPRSRSGTRVRQPRTDHRPSPARSRR